MSNRRRGWESGLPKKETEIRWSLLQSTQLATKLDRYDHSSLSSFYHFFFIFIYFILIFIFNIFFVLQNPDAIQVNFCGNSRKSMHVSVEASLKKLQTSYIDLLYVHWCMYMRRKKEE